MRNGPIWSQWVYQVLQVLIQATLPHIIPGKEMERLYGHHSNTMSGLLVRVRGYEALVLVEPRVPLSPLCIHEQEEVEARTLLQLGLQTRVVKGAGLLMLPSHCRCLLCRVGITALTAPRLLLPAPALPPCSLVTLLVMPWNVIALLSPGLLLFLELRLNGRRGSFSAVELLEMCTWGLTSKCGFSLFPSQFFLLHYTKLECSTNLNVLFTVIMEVFVP